MPVAPYPGDAVNPPQKANSGVGIRELAALLIFHALINNPDLTTDIEDRIPLAFDLADEFYKEIFQ